MNIKIALLKAIGLAVVFIGIGCAKKAPLQKTYVVEFWIGTNYHRSVLNRKQYINDFMIMPDYWAGEPNTKLENEAR